MQRLTSTNMMKGDAVPNRPAPPEAAEWLLEEALAAVGHAREAEQFAGGVVEALIGPELMTNQAKPEQLKQTPAGTLNKVSDALSGIHASLAAIEAQLARLKGR